MGSKILFATRYAAPLPRQCIYQARPALRRFLQVSLGVGLEGVAGVFVAEQIETLAGNQPEPRVTGEGDAAGDIDRVVAAELRTVDVGIGDEHRAVALIAETP